MCIIIAKYRGNKLPKKETLENCFYNNNDGAGIAYTHNGKVFIDKGYNKFDEFYKRLKELNKQYNLKNENVILHFRIGTSGNMDARATHPFPISDNVKKLQAPRLNNLSVAVAHNGVISAYTYKNADGLSDTQNFIKDFLAPLQQLNKNFYKYDKIQQLIEKTITSKLAIIDNNDIILIGQFEQGTDGNYYSNGSYKNDYFKASKYNTYNWSDYYNYYNYSAKNNWSNTTQLYHIRASELMQLNDQCYILDNNSDDLNDLYNVDEYYYIDKNYNLYILDDYYTTKQGETYFKLEQVAKDVLLYDEDLQAIPFQPNIDSTALNVNESEGAPIE